jgi:hypothetical protein
MLLVFIRELDFRFAFISGMVLFSAYLSDLLQRRAWPDSSGACRTLTEYSGGKAERFTDRFPTFLNSPWDFGPLGSCYLEVELRSSVSDSQ